ncbi:hypothetical protein BLOT_002008 [Blomia tropicalis]|nr:hypothetical protein BLOT_002008 [Blomia tropicalis]
MDREATVKLPRYFLCKKYLVIICLSLSIVFTTFSTIYVLTQLKKHGLDEAAKKWNKKLNIEDMNDAMAQKVGTIIIFTLLAVLTVVNILGLIGSLFENFWMTASFAVLCVLQLLIEFFQLIFIGDFSYATIVSLIDTSIILFYLRDLYILRMAKVNHCGPHLETIEINDSHLSIVSNGTKNENVDECQTRRYSSIDYEQSSRL